MGTWALLLGPASGGHTINLTGAKNRKLTARLTQPSEASFDIDGRHPQAMSVQELSTDLHAVYTTTAGRASIIYRGRIGGASDSLDDRSHTVSVTSADYRELLRRRILYTSDTLTYTAQDQADIAFNLIGQTQAHAGGNLSISKGLGSPTGTIRTMIYQAGDSIGDLIQTMSSMNNGFDWEITPMSPSALALNIWSSVRGSSRGVVCEYGGLIEAVRREVRPQDYANSIRVSGDQSQTTPPTQQERTASDIATRPEGRWDKALTAPDVVNLVALQARADFLQAYYQALVPSYTLTCKRGAWLGPGHIWLGDVVTVVVKSGRLAVVDPSLRVYEVAVAIGDDGIDQATLTVGRPSLNALRSPSIMDQRLRDLERR